MTAADTDAADDPLVDLYRTYIGEPDSRTDVYLGFALFFVGLGIGIVGLLLFVVERATMEGTVWWLREIAFGIGALGLPLLLVSVVVLLPADRKAIVVAAVGLAITVVSIGFFASVYPGNWNSSPPDYSLQGVTIYAVGLVSVLGATGSALVGYHIERVQGLPADVDREPAEEEAGPEVTEEQVQQDIEEAMANTELSWGGVEKYETKQLDINPDSDLEGESLERSSARVHRSGSVDDQLSKLEGMKGGEERTESSSGVTYQAAALQEVREQRSEEAESQQQGLWARIKAFLLGLVSGS
jgi:hypothetical protein